MLTKLDILTGLDEIPVCVAYDVEGTRFDEVPVNQSDFHHAKPILEYFPGWKEDISGARTFEDLPLAAQDYVLALEEMSGTRISVIGVGAVARRGHRAPRPRRLMRPASSDVRRLRRPTTRTATADARHRRVLRRHGRQRAGSDDARRRCRLTLRRRRYRR